MGTRSTISVLAVIQFAEVRPERPDDAVIASSAAALTSIGLQHDDESPASIAQRGWWRPGVVGQGNADAGLEDWLYLRAFDDLRARSDWTVVGTGTGGATTATPGAGNFEENHGDIATPAGIMLGNFRWYDLALGAGHVNNGALSRLTFDIIPSIKYT